VETVLQPPWELWGSDYCNLVIALTLALRWQRGLSCVSPGCNLNVTPSLPHFGEPVPGVHQVKWRKKKVSRTTCATTGGGGGCFASGWSSLDDYYSTRRSAPPSDRGSDPGPYLAPRIPSLAFCHRQAERTVYDPCPSCLVSASLALFVKVIMLFLYLSLHACQRRVGWAFVLRI
jgi:hypothetical protein